MKAITLHLEAPSKQRSLAGLIVALVILPIILISCGNQYFGKIPPKAVKGTIDLRGWDFVKDGPITIEGEWAFSWQQFIEPTDINNNQKNSLNNNGYLTYPANQSWEGHQLPDGRVLGHMGYATMQLRVLLPPDLATKQLAIGEFRSNTAQKLSIIDMEGELLAEPILSGVPGVSSKLEIPAITRNTLTFTQSDELIILWQLSNFHHFYGGPSAAPLMGTVEAIKSQQLATYSKDFFIMGFLCVMGLYHLVLFFIHRQDSSAFWFGIFCLQITGMAAVLDGYLNQLFLSALLFTAQVKIFNSLFVYLAPVTFILFIQSVFPKATNTRSTRFFISVFSAIALIAALLPLTVLTQYYLQVTFLLLTVPWIICAIKLLVSAEKGNNPLQAQLILAGFVILAILGVYDIAMALALIPQTYNLSTIGLCVFTICQAASIAINHRETYKAKLIATAQKQARTQYFAGMSHELRTPLTAIRGYAELIEGKAQSLADSQQYSKTIISASDHLLQIINDILDLSKIESGKMHVEKVPFSLSEIMHIIDDCLRLLAQQKNIQFDIKLNGKLPETLVSDPTRIQQIVINLCGNAIKFTKHGHVSLTLEYNDKNQIMSFIIEDTGVGMSQKTLDQIFTAFVQADSSVARQYGGTGLGLYISKQMAEALGGNITAQSEIGKGSVFSFTIQDMNQEQAEWITALAPNTAIKSSRNQTLQATHTFTALSGKLLLAEDNEANQQLIQRLIEETNIDLTLVDNGVAAIDAAANKAFDLILLDLRMPRLDGISVAKQLKESGTTTPMIAISADIKEYGMSTLVSAGFSGFVDKPINKEAFFNTLESHLKPDTQISHQSLKHVLLVEDCEINQHLIQRYIGEPGVKLAIVSNGQEAIEHIDNHHVDLVLMDMQMPVMNGEDATRALRAKGFEQPIVALTAENNAALLESYVMAGCNSYITKPIDFNKLQQTVKNSLSVINGER